MILKIILSLFFGNSRSLSSRRRTIYSRRADVEQTSRPFIRKALSDSSVREKIKELPRVFVEWVVDGDTIDVSKSGNEIRVRLDSIDCPEDGQDWGDISKFGLIKLIGGQTVSLEEHGIDDYGRTIATVYIWNEQKADWINVNERMVTLGHAWVMRRFYYHLPKDRQDKLNSLEKWARAKKVGLWSTLDPCPPWEWRNNNSVDR